jgi:hypothetical protein
MGTQPLTLRLTLMRRGFDLFPAASVAIAVARSEPSFESLAMSPDESFTVAEVSSLRAFSRATLLKSVQLGPRLRRPRERQRFPLRTPREGFSRVI